MNSIDDVFDEKKIEKAIKKAKAKLIFKIVIILILVLLIGGYINLKLCIKYSNKFYESNEAKIQLSVPNGYISEANDTFGFLGGNGTYKISKYIGGKSIDLEEHYSYFGIFPPINYTRITGGGYHISGDFPVSIWKNGYKKMRFFNPELNYKKYQNDIDNIDNIPDGKIVEMAISFDKPYKVSDLYLLKNKLMPAKITWIWLNEFTEEKQNEFNYEIENYDSEANGIHESDVIGIEVYKDFAKDLRKDSYYLDMNNNQYNEEYTNIINNLSKSYDADHKKLYEEIMRSGKTSYDDAEILGVVVHGTKEEIKSLINNPIIKATVFGIVTDPLY